MPNAYVTVDLFKDLLKRVDKLEYKVEEVDIDELSKRYHSIEKEVAVTDTKIDSLEKVMNARFNMVDERFNTVDEKFDSLEKRLDMMWKVQLLTLGVILTSIIGILIKVFL